MLTPPFIHALAPTGDTRRTTALLLRAAGVGLLLWSLPGFVEALGEVLWALFVDYDPTLRRSGVNGYADLLLLRLANMDLLEWMRERGDSVLAFGSGLALLLKPYRGPCWGEAPS